MAETHTVIYEPSATSFYLLTPQKRRPTSSVPRSVRTGRRGFVFRAAVTCDVPRYCQRETDLAHQYSLTDDNIWNAQM